MIALLGTILIALIVGIVFLRLYFCNQAKKLSEDIALDSNIKDDLEEKFHDRIITNTDKEGLLEPYDDNYSRAAKLTQV